MTSPTYATTTPRVTDRDPMDDFDRREVTLDIKQVRDQARNALREQKFEQAYLEWVKDLRSRAYVEMRDPP